MDFPIPSKAYLGAAKPFSKATMSTIPTADRFLGSLLGAYIGNCYSAYNHGPWPRARDSLLYQTWLTGIQQLNISGPKPSAASLTAAIPWLLYCHADTAARHRQLTQNITPATITKPALVITVTASLYILGDCLEWLMQCTPDTQHPHLSLCAHLQERSTTYPSATIPWVNLLIERLNTRIFFTSPQSIDQTYALSSITSALKRCLSYPENLALALANQQDTPATATIIGCLIGAWGGPMVIPGEWIMSLTQDARQSLQQISQQLYRSWAGVDTIATGFDVFPLDF